MEAGRPPETVLNPFPESAANSETARLFVETNKSEDRNNQIFRDGQLAFSKEVFFRRCSRPIAPTPVIKFTGYTLKIKAYAFDLPCPFIRLNKLVRL